MKDKLLLLHGALGSKNQLLSLKATLEKTYEVYDLNFEGHGGIQSINEFSIDLFTENVIRIFKIKKHSTNKYFWLQYGWLCWLKHSIKNTRYYQKSNNIRDKNLTGVSNHQKEKLRC